MNVIFIVTVIQNTSTWPYFQRMLAILFMSHHQTCRIEVYLYYIWFLY